MRSFIVGLCLLPAIVAAQLRAPTSMTLPGRYLDRVPLGELVMSDVAELIGLPSEQMEIGDETLWQYEVGSERRSLVELYTFVFVDGVLVDVRYINGRHRMSAIGRQSAD